MKVVGARNLCLLEMTYAHSRIMSEVPTQELWVNTFFTSRLTSGNNRLPLPYMVPTRRE